MAPKKSTKKSAASAAKEVDRQLERYRAMRDFSMTEERSGREARTRSKKENALPIVLNKKAETRLH